MTGPDQPAAAVAPNAACPESCPCRRALRPWSEEYEQAPSSPTSPISATIDEATARAVAKALKACGLTVIAGPASAAAAAGLILSELQHLGYWVIPVPAVVERGA